MRWKIFKMQKVNQLLNTESALDQFEINLKARVFEALQNYQNRRQKQTIQITFARCHSNKCLSGIALKAWSSYIT